MLSAIRAFIDLRLSLWFAFSVATLLVSCQVESSDTNPEPVTTAEAASSKGGLIDCEEFTRLVVAAPNAQIVDVRTPREYEAGNVEGSVNIDYRSSDFESQLAVLNKEQPVFVYCHSGGRSAKATKVLRAQGFSEVYDMDGGYSKWSTTQQD